MTLTLRENLFGHPLTPMATQRSQIATALEGEDVLWRTLCEKMTNPQKKRYGYAFRGSRGGFWSWWAMAEEWAGTNEWFDQDNRCLINSPDHVKGLAFWNALYQDRLAPEDSVNWGYAELVQAFWSGICGCCEQDPEVVGTCLEHGMTGQTLLTAIMPAGPKARVSFEDVRFPEMPWNRLPRRLWS